MIETLKTAIKKMDSKYFERKERDFSYELYHQLRRFQLLLDAEVTCEHPKRRFSFNDTIINQPLIKRNFFADEIDENKKYLGILICLFMSLKIENSNFWL
jgi:hypothetical protein